MNDFETHPIGTAKEDEQIMNLREIADSKATVDKRVRDICNEAADTMRALKNKRDKSRKWKTLRERDLFRRALERIQAADAATAWQLRGMANEALKSGGSSE